MCVCMCVCVCARARVCVCCMRSCQCTLVGGCVQAALESVKSAILRVSKTPVSAPTPTTHFPVRVKYKKQVTEVWLMHLHQFLRICVHYTAAPMGLCLVVCHGVQVMLNPDDPDAFMAKVVEITRVPRDRMKLGTVWWFSSPARSMAVFSCLFVCC